MTSLSESGDVVFEFYRAGVSDVFISGSFNFWSPGFDAMRPRGDGWWTATLRLPAGEYQFRYIADGEWFTDYAANGVERSRGQWNSILVVPEPVRRICRIAA